MTLQHTIKEWKEQPNNLLQTSYLPAGVISLLDINQLNLEDKKVFKKVQVSFYESPELWCYHHPSLDIQPLATIKGKNHLVYGELKKNDLLSPKIREYLIKNSNLDFLLKIDPDLVYADQPLFNPATDDALSYLQMHKASVKDANKIENYMQVWSVLYHDKKQQRKALIELNNIINVNPEGLDAWFMQHQDIFQSLCKETIIRNWFKPDDNVLRKHTYLKTLQLSHAYTQHDKAGKYLKQLKKWKKSLDPSLTFHSSSLFSYIDGDDDAKNRFALYLVTSLKKEVTNLNWFHFEETVEMVQAWINTLEIDIPLLSIVLERPDTSHYTYQEYKTYFTQELQNINEFIGAKNKSIIADEIQLNF